MSHMNERSQRLQGGVSHRLHLDYIRWRPLELNFIRVVINGGVLLYKSELTGMEFRVGI